MLIPVPIAAAAERGRPPVHRGPVHRGPVHRGPVRRDREDAGSTIVELLVAMIVFAIFALAVASVTLSVIKVATRARAVSDATTYLRSVLDQVGHTVPSASQVNTPTRVGDDWYVEALFPATPGSVTGTCTQWRLLAATDDLQVRTWNTVNPVPTTWRSLATNVVNDPTANPPFAVIPPDSAFNSYRLSFDLSVSAADVGTLTQREDFTLRNSASSSGGSQICTEVGRP